MINNESKFTKILKKLFLQYGLDKECNLYKKSEKEKNFVEKKFQEDKNATS
tara:strand:- start:4288 stop:4440 length:153 start_codon:yes stop_codon:yes gene_type:complete